MAISQDDNISLHVLDTSATDDQVLSVLDLSNSIFAHDAGSGSVRRTLAGWRARLNDPRSIIIYLRSDAGGITVAESSKVIGFFFAYPITQPEIGLESLHIWLAGIDTAYRGKRLFERLFCQVKDHAVRLTVEYLTVCTVPALFPTMYRILQKNGWEFVAWREEGDIEKVLLRMSLT